jgi:hypothetical protein
VVVPFAVTRLSLCLVAWLGFHLWRPATIFPESWQIDSKGDRGAITTLASTDPHPFANMWARWDAGWYLEIARTGYSYQAGSPSTVAFFPLYPLLIRSLHDLLFLPGTDYWFLVSGILLSNVSLIIALVYLRALLAIDYTVGIAARAVLYLLVFPTSFFLSAVYAESLFLALTIGAFFYGRQHRWPLACTLAALATVCRSQGILIVLPLLVEYLQQGNFSFRKIGWNLLSFVLPVAAIPIFLFFLSGKFGDWRVIFEAQQPWGRHLMWPWYTLSWVTHHAPLLSSEHHEWLDFSFLALLVVGVAIGLRCLRLSYSFYGWTAVVFFSSWGMLGSVPRFDLVVFPLFAVLAILGEKSGVFHTGYVISASMLAGLFMVIYSQWNWIA